ncbi:MAG: HEAT repeat domain-containing protein [Candidatus Heimdallarchaeota archaeon]|nr:HEAT repeat domain-containing protein [Candidatus Heimdallarchaeota archaeon]
MGKEEEPTFEELLEQLRDEDNWTRGSAVMKLGDLGASGDSRVVEPLIEMIKDKSNNVRKSVFHVLADLGNRQALEPLKKALKTADDYFEKARIESCLRELENKIYEEEKNLFLEKIKQIEKKEIYITDALIKYADKSNVKLLYRELWISLWQDNFDIADEIVKKLIDLGDKKQLEEELLKGREKIDFTPMGREILEQTEEYLAILKPPKVSDNPHFWIRRANQRYSPYRIRFFSDKKVSKALMYILRNEKELELLEEVAKAARTLNDPNLIKPIVELLRKHVNEYDYYYYDTYFYIQLVLCDVLIDFDSEIAVDNILYCLERTVKGNDISGLMSGDDVKYLFGKVKELSTTRAEKFLEKHTRRLETLTLEDNIVGWMFILAFIGDIRVIEPIRKLMKQYDIPDEEIIENLIRDIKQNEEQN